MRKNCYQFFHHSIKINYKKKEIRMFENINKIKFEPYCGLVDQAFCQLRIRLTIKTHIAKLYMMKHQSQENPMKLIQKKEKQTKLLHFPNSWNKYYLMMKL